MAAAGLALAVANSPLGETYQHALHAQLGPLSLAHWIADGLMALFFLLVGLEVKREWYVGQLATAEARRLPTIAAAAGMAVPALLYIATTRSDPRLAVGWAIPAATDIAFALGVLALLGARVPAAMKLLLVTIAIIDDIGAIVIIALFYTANINIVAVGAAVLIAAAMAGLNMIGVRRLWPYLVGAALLWVAVLQSGIHATIAGVVAALTIPLGRGESKSPLKLLERRIHPWVMLGIVPLFGFASAGVALTGGGALVSSLPIGVALGLFVGKQVGVFGAIWLSDRTGIASKPAHLGWRHVYGMALLCGIGFTMSLFIGALAFPDARIGDAAKVGTLAGSLLSGGIGYLVLRFTGTAENSPDEVEDVEELFGEEVAR